MQVIDMLWDDIWLLGIYERPLRTCNPAHEFWSGSLASPQALPERPAHQLWRGTGANRIGSGHTLPVASPS
jgi:hypothetical protein